MNVINRVVLSIAVISVLFLVSGAFTLNAQSFMPSPQQIEQFKNLPRAQQEQLARQMGFDISMLDGATNNSQSIDSRDEIDFVERQINNDDIAKELSKQSVVEDSTATLMPFGYDIFESRDEPAAPTSNMPVPPDYIIGPGDSVKIQLFGKETGDFELVVNNEGDLNIPDIGPLNVSGTNFTELKNLVKEKYEQQKIGVTSFVSMGQLRTIQIFLVGEVYQPGPLVVSGLSTVTSALINSGGVNEIGSLRNIHVKRNGKTVANFDLYDLIVFGDTSKDVRLQQGDVLFVPTAQTIVSVDGQVRRPAIYEMVEGETLSDLLKLIGGFLPSADTSSVQLVRSEIGEGLSITNFAVDNKVALEQKLINGDFVRVPRANQEFKNAILVNGAINLPNIISDKGQSLQKLITKRTVLANTDLDYALVLRKSRFDQNTTVIQFRPVDVIERRFDLELKPFDELIVFNRVSGADFEEQDEVEVVSNVLASSDDLKSQEATFLQDAETNRFTTDIFEQEVNSNFSRKELLEKVGPLIQNQYN